MRAFLAWMVIGLLAVTCLSVAQGTDGDENLPVIERVVSAGRDRELSEDIGPHFSSTANPPSRAAAVPSGNLIQMNRIAQLPKTNSILTASNGLDLDGDGRREFILRALDGTLFGGGVIEFYENTADDTFALAHVIEIVWENDPDNEFLFYVPGDAGDGDGDGLVEAVLHGTVGPDYTVSVYESVFMGAYPTELVWQTGGPGEDGFFLHKFARIADIDDDASQEIVVVHTFTSFDRLSLHENDGDNSYHVTYSEQLPGFMQSQSMTLLSDLDGDGRDEILIGGIASAGGSLLAYESTGDDTIALSWTWLFDPFINVSFVVDAGDLDGDGRKEFLAGGHKPESGVSLLHVFEATGDNRVEITDTLTRFDTLTSSTEANVADVDGDGKKEIVFATSGFSIYKNLGFGWTEVWSGGGATTTSISSIGAGDHDRDGKDEIIILNPGLTDDVTAVYEIDPAYAADMDGDDAVDAIDNCPAQFNPGQEDVDADGVGDVCDNCLHGPNPGQGPAPLGQSLVASDRETFSWPAAADVVYVRGALPAVSAYAIDTVDSLAMAVSVTDTSVPAAGSGFYYLVRPDCLVGSWQTTVGAEPARDAALP